MKLLLVFLATAYASGPAINLETGNSYGIGKENGYGIAKENGNGKGNVNGYGNSNEKGFVNGNINGNQNGYGNGNQNGYGNGNQNGYGNGYENDYETIGYDQPGFDRYTYGYGSPEDYGRGLIEVPYPYVIGRQGIGFDKRTAFAYGFRMPLTADLLKVLRRYPEKAGKL